MEQQVASLLTDNILERVAGMFGTARADLELLGDFENFVYGYEKDGRAAVLRLTHSSHRDADQIQAELDWVKYLGDHGARVAGARFSENGRLVEKLELEGGAFYVAAFDRAPGEAVGKDNRDRLWNEALFREWGRTIGQMHALTKTYEPGEGRPRRIAWFEDDDHMNAAKYLPDSEAAIIETCHRLAAEARALPTDRDSYGLIHTDIHPGNFFVQNGRMTVFDFDDAAYNFFASDIAIALYYALWFLGEGEDREGFAQRFMTAFMAGYGEENDFAPDWLESIPLFLRLRDAVLYVVLHKKWEMDKLNERQRSLVGSIKDRLERGVPTVAFDFRTLC